jgi:hypothetical protein
MNCVGQTSSFCKSAELLLIAGLCLTIQHAACQLGWCPAASNLQNRLVYAGRETFMLWTVFAILLLLWLLGWGFHVAGSLIHLILVIALVVMVIELITGRRAAFLKAGFLHWGHHWYRLCRGLAGAFFS